MKSNKTLGLSFEQELSRTLSNRGYWCKVLQTGTGQPCDIIAAKGNCAYFIEAKTAKGDTFSTLRAEANQRSFYEFSLSCGNTNCFLVVRFKSGVRVFHFGDVLGAKSLRFDDGLEVEFVFE